jgi:hypothetical protein
MAFEKLAPHIDFIEKALGEKKSPRAIANELGDPGLYTNIWRYKVAVFDLNKEASLAWKLERAKSHEQRLDEGKAEIVNTLEVINLGKLRAKQLLGLEIGSPYETAEGEPRSLSFGSAVIYWQAGQKMICDLSKAEMELGGDDPESRKADAMQDWADTRLALLGAVDDDPKAKQKLIAALEQRRRSSLCSGSRDMGPGGPGIPPGLVATGASPEPLE